MSLVNFFWSFSDWIFSHNSVMCLYKSGCMYSQLKWGFERGESKASRTQEEGITPRCAIGKTLYGPAFHEMLARFA
jgi:hypothetical protein